MTSTGASLWNFGLFHGAALAPAGANVVKFGGSLLDRRDWPELASQLLSTSGFDTATTFVVGGGSIVDGLRQIDQTRRQSDRLTHHLAVEGMGITAKLVAAALGLPLVTRPGGRHAVIDPVGWLAADPLEATTIPASWQVTSDSLAARVAGKAGLDLWLAKSVAPPLGDALLGAAAASRADRLAGLANAGWVDGWFPIAAAAVGRIGWAVPAG